MRVLSEHLRAALLGTHHVHGFLALGQRGELGLGVVQSHSLPQGAEVTWVALLRTQNTQGSTKTHKTLQCHVT